MEIPGTVKGWDDEEGKNRGVILTYTRLLIGVSVLMILAGILTFRGGFRFWDDALSYLGATTNTKGLPNPLSPLFFDSGLLVSAFLCWRISSALKNVQLVNKTENKILLLRIAATGYLLMITPCDLLNDVHMVGSILVFGSFWLLEVQMILEVRKRNGFLYALILQLILQGTILPYAYSYMILRTSVKQFWQKIAVFGLLLILGILMENLFRMNTGDLKLGNEPSDQNN